MEMLSPDVWGLVGAHLAAADLRALALACPRLLPEIRRIVGTKRVSVTQGMCADVCAHWEVTDLAVRGLSPLLCLRRPLAPLSPPSLPGLRRLALVEVRLATGFWPTVFAACPALEDVDVECRWFPGRRYEEDVSRAQELVALGAPRLRRLRVAGGGQRHRTDDPPATVHSSTLREYVAMCPEAPVPVCAALDVLETSARLLRGLLPPGTSVRRAVVHEVGDMDALRSLPAGLEQLQVRSDCLFRCAPYGQPLAHVTGLRDLDLRMRVPPVGEAALDLVGQWLGVGPAIRRVRASFVEPATYWLEQAMDDLAGSEGSEEFAEALAMWHEAARLVSADGLRRWMDRHPHATVSIANFRSLLAPPCVLDALRLQ